MNMYLLLIVVLIFTPHLNGENINCNGKGFYCVDSSHFLICVDIGGGIVQTVNEEVQACPAGTFCDNDNLFECMEIIDEDDERNTIIISMNSPTSIPSTDVMTDNDRSTPSPPQHTTSMFDNLFTTLRLAISSGPSIKTTFLQPDLIDKTTSTMAPSSVTTTKATTARPAVTIKIPSTVSLSSISPLVLKTTITSSVHPRSTLPDTLSSLLNTSITPPVFDASSLLELISVHSDPDDFPLTTPKPTTPKSIEPKPFTAKPITQKPTTDNDKSALTPDRPIAINIQNDSQPINVIISSNVLFVPTPDPPVKIPLNIPAAVNDNTACQIPGIFPDELSCHSYYKCNNNIRYKLTCSYNMVYSPTLQQCTTSKDHCVNYNTISCNKIGRIPDPKSCYSYFDCQPSGAGYRVARYHCPWYSTFQPSTGLCVLSNSVCGCQQVSQACQYQSQNTYYNDDVIYQGADTIVKAHDGSNSYIFFPDELVNRAPIAGGRQYEVPSWSRPEIQQTPIVQRTPNYYNAWISY